MAAGGSQQANVNNNFESCSLASEKYKLLKSISTGLFGQIYKVHCRKDPSQVFAMKQYTIRNRARGVPASGLREISILQKVNHPNIIKMIEVCNAAGNAKLGVNPSIYLVLEFCEYCLNDLVFVNKVQMSSEEIKHVFFQIFTGLDYLHQRKILHRDMKNCNVLLTAKGIVKISDFGLSRDISTANDNTPKNLTNKVVTNWYRAPELLLGDTDYGAGIDIWGTGCMMSETFTKTVLFMGESDVELIKQISQVCGSMTPEVWPDIVKMPLYDKITIPADLNANLEVILADKINDTQALDLIKKLLTIDPSKRLNCTQALEHEFLPKSPSAMVVMHMLRQFKNYKFH